MRVSGNRRPRGGRSNSSNGRSGSSNGRGNSGNNRRSNNGNRSYDSNGPDGKIRGSATQVYDKYVSLGRDAQTSGDHVAAENYYQHGEHYYRIMLANNLVKLDRSSENDEEANNNGDDENQTDATEVATSNEREKSEASDNSAADEIVQEPIIIDLSDPDRAEPAEKNKVSSQAVAQDEGDAAEEASTSGAGDADGDEKPKTKRRVSRARGLRRRTTPRKKASDEENDEPQTA
jgi:uncharacterized protein DUF4167